MIKIWHIKNEFGHSGNRDAEWNMRADVQCFRDERFILAVKEVIGAGGYIPVATFQPQADLNISDACERAWTVTQNGVVSDSWSQYPTPGLTPIGETYFIRFDAHTKKDVRLGRKSSDIGDLFEIGGKFYACFSYGFQEIPGVRVSADGNSLENVV